MTNSFAKGSTESGNATEDFTSMSGRQIRGLCRANKFTSPTTGAAMGFSQANLVILPLDFARDFEQFCKNNPRPCPIIEITALDSPEPKKSAPGADVRTDLPRYRVYKKGKLVDQCLSIEKYWPVENAGSAIQQPLVAFLIGCSFTFEAAMLHAGLPVRHIEEGRNVPMYRTNIECVPAGPFQAPLVVSMRPMLLEQAELASKITSQMPGAHGAPVHTGDPQTIGIQDISKPDYGDAVKIKPGEVPVFWACGVTPMEAILLAKPPIAIVHEPGHMFVTDIGTQAQGHEGT